MAAHLEACLLQPGPVRTLFCCVDLEGARCWFIYQGPYNETFMSTRLHHDMPELGIAGVLKSAEKPRVVIEAGPFWMGCDENTDKECMDIEKPGRLINLADFTIDRAEVTTKAYKACVEAGAALSLSLVRLGGITRER